MRERRLSAIQAITLSCVICGILGGLLWTMYGWEIVLAIYVIVIVAVSLIIMFDRQEDG
jgi:uncharacterized membrane protein